MNPWIVVFGLIVAALIVACGWCPTCNAYGGYESTSISGGEWSELRALSEKCHRESCESE